MELRVATTFFAQKLLRFIYDSVISALQMLMRIVRTVWGIASTGSITVFSLSASSLKHMFGCYLVGCMKDLWCSCTVQLLSE